METAPSRIGVDSAMEKLQVAQEVLAVAQSLATHVATALQGAENDLPDTATEEEEDTTVKAADVAVQAVIEAAAQVQVKAAATTQLQVEAAAPSQVEAAAQAQVEAAAPAQVQYLLVFNKLLI